MRIAGCNACGNFVLVECHRADSGVLAVREPERNIIEIKGGLGNQMFQIALAKSFQMKKIPVEVDYSYYTSGQQERSQEIKLFKNVDIPEAAECLSAWMRGYGYHDSVPTKVMRKLSRRKGHIYQEDVKKGYQPEVFELKNTYISGYWQCERYFAEYRSDILEMFRFPEERANNNCKVIGEQIREDRSAVALHVRRGDYLSKKYENVYRDVCTLTYYSNAIEAMYREKGNCHFYVFSDDISWCKRNFGEKNFFYVSCNYGMDSAFDIWLMSLCRNNIVANSSFSWWGAWLNQNPDKLVMIPERWFHHIDTADQICSDWIKIPIGR